MTLQEELSALNTPCLILDEAKMLANIERLASRARQLGVRLRPHLKTAKSIEVARLTLSEMHGPATVSTLAEAEFFAAHGVMDILYAVGISPQKLDKVLSIRKGGCDMSILLDSVEQASAVAEAVRSSGKSIPVLIEIDSDGHRGGLRPDDPALIVIGRILGACNSLGGVLTHAGESYNVSGAEAHADYAELERSAAVAAADALRRAGLDCPIVSVGSTPTAHAARDLTGVTELRAGVYVFFDLVMAGIEVCSAQQIALSVLTTVIGHQPSRNWIMVDAGWMALSRDRGTAAQKVDQGYGVVCTVDGEIIPDLIVVSANQEHGIVSLREGSGATLPNLPVGTRLRILPVHACATAAQHDFYDVLPAGGGQMQVWPRMRGW